MPDFDWTSLFEPATSAQWIEKINADHTGDTQENLLIHNAGEGIHSHAVLTREDIRDLPHLSDVSPYNHVTWHRNPEWTICAPLPLSPLVNENTHRAKTILGAGAQSLLVEYNPALSAQDFAQTTSHIQALDAPVHYRLPSHLAQPLLAHHERNRIKSLQNIDAIPASPVLKEPLFTRIESLSLPEPKTLTAWLPECGNTPQQSLGNMLLHFNAFLHEHQDQRQQLLDLLNRLIVVVHVGPLFYLEIARMRALRHVISRLVAAVYPDFDKPLSVPFFAEIQSTGKALPQALIEASTKAFSAVTGGCDVLIIRPDSSINALPDLEHIRLTTNVQLILKHEAHLNQVIDPGAGSYHIEWLTHQLIETAWRHYEST